MSATSASTVQPERIGYREKVLIQGRDRTGRLASAVHAPQRGEFRAHRSDDHHGKCVLTCLDKLGSKP